MSFEEFTSSLSGLKPPTTASRALQALWRDGRGDWDGAHADAQAETSRDGSWVHAYLHRKEGDLSNAGYWYSRAGQPMPAASVTLETEWETIVRGLLAR